MKENISIIKMQKYLESRYDYYMKIFKDMVDINSYTKNISGVNQLGIYTAQIFESLDFKAETIQSLNLSNGRHLILKKGYDLEKIIGCVSHLDTVFTPEDEKKNNFSWRVDGDRIYGPGTNDIKGGTIIIFMMLDVLAHMVPKIFNRVGWFLAFDSSEETESDDFGDICINYLKDKGLACLVFEGDGSSADGYSLVTARKGRAVFRITIEGKGAHAGAKHKSGANAIVQMAEVVKLISELTDYKNELTFNIGTISGGTVINRVPHECIAEVEMRAFSPSVFEKAISQIMALSGFSSVQSADGKYSCVTKVELLRKNSAWPENDNSKNIFKCWYDAADSLGVKVIHKKRGGLSDGNFTWEHVPTIDGLGPKGGNAHCSESLPDGSKEQEYSLASSFIPKALLNSLAVIKLIEDNVDQ